MTWRGYLGGFGDWLFRTGFLGRDFAHMMRGSLERGKRSADAGTDQAPPD